MGLMRKILFSAIAALALVTACDPPPERPAAVSYDVPPTTAGDPDGPAVDRGSADVRSDVPTLPAIASDDAGTSESERERFGSWDGTGDVPYGDDPDNDGRFSDIACDTFDDQGMTCRYGDGTIAAQGIDYSGGFWYWGATPISRDGQCPSEDSCSIAWDHSTTSPYAVSR